MGLLTTLKAKTSSSRRASRRQEQEQRHDYHRQNDGLLAIALQPRRMWSLTMLDPTGFYRREREREEEEKLSREGVVVGGDRAKGKEQQELGDSGGAGLMDDIEPSK